MAQIRSAKAGQALAARGNQSEKRAAVLQKDIFKLYTLINTGEKVWVNESEIFPEKPEYIRWAV